MITSLLENFSQSLIAFIESKNINGVVGLFPFEIEIKDDKWHFFIDLDNIEFIKYSTMTASAIYMMRLSIAKRVDNYVEFITGISEFLQELIEYIMGLLLINRIEIGEFGYDTINGCGSVSLLMRVGFE